MKPRLKEVYEKTVIPGMMKEFKYKSVMQVPKLKKIVINRGVGEGAQDIKAVELAVEELTRIAGQKPVVTRAKKSEAGFKIRKGNAIGCKVTLRSDMMYEFFDRLVNVALPRVRDFRGVPMKSFDGRGNYNLGITEQIIFPEIDYDSVKKITGMDVSIETSAKTDREAGELLKLLGMPFQRQQN